MPARWSRRAHSGCAWCGRSATPPIRAWRRKRCGGRSTSRVPDEVSRPVAEARRKRKERGAPRPTPRERMEAGYAKAEVRNQAAREALVPLAPGERPPVVTVSAILAALVAISILVTYAAGVQVNGRDPAFTAAAGPALIMGVLAWGMWRARYWAVVCFQAVLVFLIFAAVYALLVE